MSKFDIAVNSENLSSVLENKLFHVLLERDNKQYQIDTISRDEETCFNKRDRLLGMKVASCVVYLNHKEIIFLTTRGELDKILSSSKK